MPTICPSASAWVSRVRSSRPASHSFWSGNPVCLAASLLPKLAAPWVSVLAMTPARAALIDGTTILAVGAPSASVDAYTITAYVTLANGWITYIAFAWSLLLPAVFFDPPSSAPI